MKTLALALGIIAVSRLAMAEPIKIHVRHEAQIASSNVELGAISEISATNVGDETMLAGLILGEAPEAGKKAEWTAAEISKRLRPYGRILQKAQVKLPDRIVIRRAVNGITREELTRRIEDMLKATLPDSSWEVKLQEAQLPPLLDIPRDGSVQVVPLLTRPKGAAQFEVVINRNGKTEARRWFNGRVSYFAPVAVIKRQIEPHTHISDTDVKWEKKDVTFMPDISASQQDLATAVSRSALSPGQILTRSALEREMALRFGDEVDLQAGDDSFSVSTKAVAQQNGYLGDTVKVKIGPNKFLTGTVVARNTVRIHY